MAEGFAAGGLTVEDLPFLPRNDGGNATRLSVRAAGRLLYVWNVGWCAWTGTHWSYDRGEEVALKLAWDTARAIEDEARAVEAERADLAKSLRAWAVKSGETNKVNGMLAQAKERLAARRDEFDRHPWALNVQNGTLWFARGPGESLDVTLRPHDPADRLTRIATVAYDPAATASLWLDHLEFVLPDPEVRAFVQRAMGLSITGETREQRTFMWQGRGGDGKSTTLAVARQVLGTYATTADVATFLEDGQKFRSGAQASPDLVKLAGDTRFVQLGEPPAGAAIAETRVKQATGETPIQARDLNRGLFEFLFKGKLFWEVNRRPRISGDDDAMWRRFDIVLFPVQIPRERIEAVARGLRHASLADHVAREEGSGVLNWLIAGLADYVAGGLDPPDALAEIKQEWRKDSSALFEWLATAVEKDADAVELSSALYASFKAFCEEAGVEAWKLKTFVQRLGDLQIRPTKACPKTRRKRLKGLRLKPEAEPGGFNAEPGAPVDAEEAF